MTRKIRLIWDFRGGDGNGIAKHHAVHLKEFAQKNNLEQFLVDFQELSEMHSIAFIEVLEKDMIIVRDALIPHRGELVE